MQACHLNHQLTPVPRLGQRNVADVKFEVYLAFLDPVGAINAERWGDQALAKDRVDRHAISEVLENVLVADLASRRGRNVIYGETRDVVVDVLVLLYQEEVVRPAQLLHALAPIIPFSRLSRRRPQLLSVKAGLYRNPGARAEVNLEEAPEDRFGHREVAMMTTVTITPSHAGSPNSAPTAAGMPIPGMPSSRMPWNDR